MQNNSSFDLYIAVSADVANVNLLSSAAMFLIVLMNLCVTENQIHLFQGFSFDFTSACNIACETSFSDMWMAKSWLLFL